MYDYRLYCLNHTNGIIGVQTATCPDDDAALAHAEAELPKAPKCAGIEVWRRDRLIGRVGHYVTQ